MAILNPVLSVARKPTTPLSHLSTFSSSRRDTPNYIASIPPKIISSSSSSSFPAKPLNLTTLISFGAVGQVRVSASSGGDGSGGTGGGKSGGGGGGGSGGEGWSESGGEAQERGSLLSWYLGLLEKNPVATKAITSALLTMIGDLICQISINKVSSPDLKRTFIFSLLGLVLVGPTLHFWYLTLSKLVTKEGVIGALLRLVLDQLIFSPIFIGVFLSMVEILEGRPSQVVPKLQQDWFPAVTTNWSLWIPFQFINFRFVPLQFQVLAANVIALIWNVQLSLRAYEEIRPIKEGKKKSS